MWRYLSGYIVLIFAHYNQHLRVQTTFLSIWFYSVASNHLDVSVHAKPHLFTCKQNIWEEILHIVWKTLIWKNYPSVHITYFIIIPQSISYNLENLKIQMKKLPSGFMWSHLIDCCKSGSLFWKNQARFNERGVTLESKNT